MRGRPENACGNREAAAALPPAAAPLPPEVGPVLAAARAARLPLISGPGPASARDALVLVAVVRDEAPRLDAFLAHYRALGVGRFAIADNGSRDGTRARLAAEPDVDLWAAEGSFAWPAKQGWILALIARYGYGRWYVCVDADEHLVFAGAGPRDLHHLIGLAEAQGLSRVRGTLVDMYGPGPLAAAPAPGEDGGDPARDFPFFDPGPCPERLILTRISRTGGPRARAFSSPAAPFAPELSKYPLVLVREGEVPCSPHYLYPWRENYRSPCLVGLLHFKFTAGFPARVAAALAERRYWRASHEYRLYAAALARDPALGLVFPGSRAYGGPAESGARRADRADRLARKAAPRRALASPPASDPRRPLDVVDGIPADPARQPLVEEPLHLGDHPGAFLVAADQAAHVVAGVAVAPGPRPGFGLSFSVTPPGRRLRTSGRRRSGRARRAGRCPGSGR